VCIDSGSVDDVVQDLVIRDRRHLSEDGIVLPIVAINRQSGRVESLPERRSAPTSSASSRRRRRAAR
jgi:ribonuclease J